MTDITLSEFANGLAAVIKRVEVGETLTITRHGATIAELRPVAPPPAPVPWKRSPSAGIPGSARAADGRTHLSGFGCPPDHPRYLSEDRHLWLDDWPTPNLKTVDRALTQAFPQRKRT